MFTDGKMIALRYDFDGAEQAKLLSDYGTDRPAGNESEFDRALCLMDVFSGSLKKSAGTTSFAS